jgi:hypothetical protein
VVFYEKRYTDVPKEEGDALYARLVLMSEDADTALREVVAWLGPVIKRERLAAFLNAISDLIRSNFHV